MAGTHEASDEDRPYNTLVVLRDGHLITHYRKLHLYDAFGGGESRRVRAADAVPETFEVNGFHIGLMTCYDVRFPELARLLAVRGADVIALPAAWANGPGKRAHWETLVRARALDNTVAAVGSGECGDGCVGSVGSKSARGQTSAIREGTPALRCTPSDPPMERSWPRESIVGRRKRTMVRIGRTIASLISPISGTSTKRSAIELPKQNSKAQSCAQLTSRSPA
ncbi:nitrilase-related carbon-nitrogen hydrolase [Microbispora sp. GKU 823]|uniref:nitrilase-related carbon-nitrogen hydrolase n=1 Tax=Microbispora sp. GKU 823 TaxID=1652100 RepID=UPI0009A27FB7|nr:hypothetical protein B1L11_26070 [Microbispora sp. GKU 823]